MLADGVVDGHLVDALAAQLGPQRGHTQRAIPVFGRDERFARRPRRRSDRPRRIGRAPYPRHRRVCPAAAAPLPSAARGRADTVSNRRQIALATASGSPGSSSGCPPGSASPRRPLVRPTRWVPMPSGGRRGVGCRPRPVRCQLRSGDCPPIGRSIASGVGRPSSAARSRDSMAASRAASSATRADRPVSAARSSLTVRPSRVGAILGAATADQKSTGAGTGSSRSMRAPTPSFSLMRFSTSLAMSGFSRRKVRTFSLP